MKCSVENELTGNQPNVFPNQYTSADQGSINELLTTYGYLNPCKHLDKPYIDACQTHQKIRSRGLKCGKNNLF